VSRLSRTGRILAVALAGLVCVTLVGTGYASARAAAHHEDQRTQATPSVTAAAPSTGTVPIPSQPSVPAPAPGPVVVAIGDSIMAGHGLNPDRAWLALLASERGWQLTNLASDGSGFVAVGSNGDTFADQAAAAELLHPDVVIFSGSSNDLGVSDSRIDAATAATIGELHAALPTTMIISVSAVWGDTEVPGQLSAIDSAVESATAAAGGIFVEAGQPLAEEPALMQSDQVHPTADGQLMIARAAQLAMLSSGVTF
jgi:acyl-CoA thioesterase-1